MNAKTNATASERKPVLALLLSLGAVGLGHIYCGRFAKGLSLFFLSFVFVPVLSLAMRRPPGLFALALMLGALAGVAALVVYAAADAWLLARKVRRDYALKEYNRWYVYLLFILFSLYYPANYAGMIRENVTAPFKIPSASMEPTLLKGDYVLLNKTTYLEGPVAAGDVVIFVYPNDRRIYYMKRVAAMPGQTVEIRDGRLIVDGVFCTYGDAPAAFLDNLPEDLRGRVKMETNGALSYPVIPGPQEGDAANFPKTVVPNGHCFVLGDNRAESRDSRVFGPVPLADVKGRVEYAYLPAETWARFGPVPYAAPEASRQAAPSP